MSSDLEHQIQKKIRALPEDQQRHVLNIIEELLREAVLPREADTGKYSFTGIAHSGQHIFPAARRGAVSECAALK
jgi:hypothetical protein